ncbi:cytochrome P450 [Streptomyces hebeiensis]|uniref:Cytochrome P450 n=1 Tax=Streptomyces hebeiensis TaxID=229486 RepID=A0ABN1UYM9_9ACTN
MSTSPAPAPEPDPAAAAPTDALDTLDGPGGPAITAGPADTADAVDTADAADTTGAASATGAAGPPPGCPAHQGPAVVRLGDPVFQTDPTRAYREMRRDHGPVVPIVLEGGVPAWLVIGYRELHQLLADPVLFSRDSDLWNQWDRIPADWPLRPSIGQKQPSILYTVGERHRVRSAMLSDALEEVDPFALRRYAELYADELVDGFCTEGRADIVHRYAALLPVRVLAKVFGFADELGPGLVTALNDMMDGGARALAGQRHLATSMGELLAGKRAAPGDDVASLLLENTHGFTDEEISEDLMVLVTAGHQPTADWIGNSLRLMLTDERFAVSLAGGRHSVAEAMNEVLWEDTPSQNIAGRWATRDTSIGDRLIKAGDMLVLGFAGANFDPQVRTDGSALTGGNNAFFSFGHGEHRCPFPAQETAEVIARTAIEVLLDRLPDLDLAVPESALTWRPSPFMRGLTSLPVTFTPAPVYGDSR